MDLQRDFLESAGRLPIAQDQIAGVVDAMNRALRLARDRRWPIVYVVNGYDLLDPGNLFRNFAAVRGSQGARIDERILRLADVLTLDKKAPDAFSNPALAARLGSWRIGRLLIGGVYADACVTATAISALKRGYEVAILADGVGAASERGRQRALANLSRRGASMLRGSTEAFEVAGGARFCDGAALGDSRDAR